MCTAWRGHSRSVRWASGVSFAGASWSLAHTRARRRAEEPDSSTARDAPGSDNSGLDRVRAPSEGPLAADTPPPHRRYSDGAPQGSGAREARRLPERDVARRPGLSFSRAG